MNYLKDAYFLIPFFFAAIGFFLGYYLRKGLSFVFLGVFLYGAFKGLETLKFAPDWKNFNQFILTLQQLGHTLVSLISNMVASAGTISIFLFLSGGVLGLIASRKGA